MRALGTFRTTRGAEAAADALIDAVVRLEAHNFDRNALVQASRAICKDRFLEAMRAEEEALLATGPGAA